MRSWAFVWSEPVVRPRRGAIEEWARAVASEVAAREPASAR